MPREKFTCRGLYPAKFTPCYEGEKVRDNGTANIVERITEARRKNTSFWERGTSQDIAAIDAPGLERVL